MTKAYKCDICGEFFVQSATLSLWAIENKIRDGVCAMRDAAVGTDDSHACQRCWDIAEDGARGLIEQLRARKRAVRRAAEASELDRIDREAR